MSNEPLHPFTDGTGRAYSLLKATKANEQQRVIEGMATTPTPDRVDDVVEPMGAKFKNPMPLLFHHDHSKPVGTVEFGKPTKSGIPFKAKINEPKADYPPALTERLQEAWVSVRDRLIAGVSIGFRNLKSEPIDGSFGVRFLEWEGLELSLVTVPANAEASIQTVKSIDKGEDAASGAKRKSVVWLNDSRVRDSSPRKKVHYLQEQSQ